MISLLFALSLGLCGVSDLHYQQIPRQRPGRGSIQGLVTDDRGHAILGARVILKRGVREIARTETSGDGVFRFLDVAPGEYAISIEKDGFSPVNQPGLRITGPELVTVELKLQPTSPRAEPKKIEP